MPYGLPWSEDFIRQIADKDDRKEFVADQVRARISLMIRALREARGWSQTKLGKLAHKPQNVISRLENPDYGKPSLETLLEVAAAFDLPLYVDIPDWEDWLRRMGNVPSAKNFVRRSFDVERMAEDARQAKSSANQGNIVRLPISAGAASSKAGKLEEVSAKTDRGGIDIAYTDGMTSARPAKVAMYG